MTTDASHLLDRLQAFLRDYQRKGRTYAQFWADFDRETAELERLAAGDQLPAAQADRYFDLRDAAHDGYGCPPERMNDLME